MENCWQVSGTREERPRDYWYIWVASPQVFWHRNGIDSSESSHPGCSRGLLEFWLAYPYQFSVFPHAHRLIKCRIKEHKRIHDSLIHRKFPSRMVFIIFITPRRCSEQCFPGEKLGDISGFRLLLRGTLFLLGVDWLIFIYNAGEMTWWNVEALDLVSFVNSQNLGLKIELFPTHLNSCPPWQPCWWGDAKVRPPLSTLLVPTREPKECHSSWWTCLDHLAAYQAVQITPEHSSFWMCLRHIQVHNILKNIRFPAFRARKCQDNQGYVCVCVCMYCCLLEGWSSNPSRNWQGMETHMAPGCF